LAKLARAQLRTLKKTAGDYLMHIVTTSASAARTTRS
jgi:hypothetical protein